MRRITAGSMPAMTLICIALAAILPPFPLFGEGDNVFAPFVTRIRAGTKPDAIILTWEDSPEIDGSYVVFRSKTPISLQTIAQAKEIATVPPGTMRWEDKPGDISEYYYAVLGKSSSGTLYQVFIPFKNATSIGMSVASPAFMEPSPGPATPGGITATVVQDAVRLSLSFEEKGHRFIVYRGLDPVVSSKDLLRGTTVAIVADKTKTLDDYPVPGIPYYYAAIDERDLQSGTVKILPGLNATVKPVRIEAGAFRIGLPRVPALSRSAPLPFLNTDRSFVFASTRAIPSPNGAELRSETVKAIDSILAISGTEDLGDLPIVPLPSLTRPAGPDDITLDGVVEESVNRSDWDLAVEELEKYLSVRRGADAEKRAHYYLGIAYAKRGDVRDGLFSLLQCGDLPQNVVQPAVSWCLFTLRSGGDAVVGAGAGSASGR